MHTLKKIFLFLLIFVLLNSLFLIHNSPAWAASFSLSPATLSKNVGDTFSVDIVLDPGTDSVSAASAIINYDTTKLTALSVTQGALFNMTPLANTINTSTGQINYDSGNLGTAVTTRGTMATISFRAIAAGSAGVSFVFDPVATTGTSLIAASSGPTNVLSSVNNGSYTIAGASSAPLPTTYYTLPSSGVVENTIAIFVGGIFFLSTGLVLAKKYVQ